MEPQMVQTLLVSIAFFTVLYVTLVWHRIRLERFAGYVEQLKAKFTSA
jgi:heme exporter protein C